MTDILAPREQRLQQLVEQLRLHNAQLEQALETRVTIEQAKGILAERYGLSVDDAFALLRRTARSNRMRLHTLAEAVVTQTATPPEIELERAKLLSASP